MKRFLLLLLSAILGLCIVIYLKHKATLHPKQVPFSRWYAAHASVHSTQPSLSKVYTYVYTSPELRIDKLYKSMQGPTVSEPISLATTWQKLKQYAGFTELYWLTGYSVEILDADDHDKQLSPEFMCHNNLNILDKEKMPWLARTYGIPLRLFTLTQGQTSISLPQGYGIPVLADMKLLINSQVLNHNQPLIHKKVKHRVTIYFVKDSELTMPMTALFEQSVLVTRQCQGPPGAHDTPPYEIQSDPLTFKDIDADPEPVCCSMEKRDSLEYNPYLDSYGRAFTGHWNFHPGGPEIDRTDVTRMLGLAYDTPLHFISVHVHPYCESLELIDKSDNKSIYKALVQNSVGKTGMDRIDFLTAAKGIMLYKQHAYELVSTYRNTTSQDQTAMAVMFLYLEDKETSKD